MVSKESVDTWRREKFKNNRAFQLQYSWNLKHKNLDDMTKILQSDYVNANNSRMTQMSTMWHENANKLHLMGQ
jgi:hypothetical protein